MKVTMRTVNRLLGTLETVMSLTHAPTIPVKKEVRYLISFLHRRGREDIRSRAMSIRKRNKVRYWRNKILSEKKLHYEEEAALRAGDYRYVRKLVKAHLDKRVNPARMVVGKDGKAHSPHVAHRSELFTQRCLDAERIHKRLRRHKRAEGITVTDVLRDLCQGATSASWFPSHNPRNLT